MERVDMAAWGRFLGRWSLVVGVLVVALLVSAVLAYMPPDTGTPLGEEYGQLGAAMGHPGLFRLASVLLACF